MRADRISVAAFRNLRDVDIAPVAGVNVICGENGQGKTNLLEAMWLFTGSRSFRGAHDMDMRPRDGTPVDMSLYYTAFSREMCARITHADKKKILLNGIEEKGPSALGGSLYAVVFSPAHLTLIRGAPEDRRQTADAVIAQLKPRYRQVLLEYRRLLVQRNTLLRDAQFSPPLLDTLDVWDESLAKMGALVTRTRRSFIERLAPIAEELYCGISGGREKLEMRYVPSINADGGEDYESALAAALRQSRSDDMRCGTTSVGPQRDDVAFILDGMPAKSYASQGQQRSAVLAYKLAECTLCEQVTGETPLVLLDDVMSELDERRRDYLLHHLDNRQIFLTCCDPHQIRGAEAVFTLAAGRVTSGQ